MEFPFVNSMIFIVNHCDLVSLWLNLLLFIRH